MDVIISIVISVLAYNIDKIDFWTVFTYVTTAFAIRSEVKKLLKKLKKYTNEKRSHHR